MARKLFGGATILWNSDYDEVKRQTTSPSAVSPLIEN